MSEGTCDGSASRTRGTIQNNLQEVQIRGVTHTLDHENWKATRKSGSTDDPQIEYWTYMYEHPGNRQKPVGARDAARQIIQCYMMRGVVEDHEFKEPFTNSQKKKLLSFFEESSEQTIFSPQEGQRLYDEPTRSNRPIEQKRNAVFLKDYGIPSQFEGELELMYWVILSSVRFSRDQKTFDKSLSPPLHFLSSVLFWGAPRNHFERINVSLLALKNQKSREAWSSHLSKVGEELGISNLVATVLLAATTGLLAVPGMVDAARILTLSSMICTLGSIMSGVYLQWQTGKLKYVHEDLLNASTLAILFSVPFAAGVWGMVLFSAAIITFSKLGQETLLATPVINFGRPTWGITLGATFFFVITTALVVVYFRLLRHRDKKRLGPAPKKITDVEVAVKDSASSGKRGVSASPQTERGTLS